ncbi:uncharacterized protein N7482_000097 [Penicillium canariense]|uniref:Uncharacterized protein n=1 Tax=Penicillium canariense TaxID=189055 RepID=A0A9W9IDS1_9EURO|nr:uncharacterized protein N7482_000097 [Penicillium canariense]KAJ5174220.1 hypothetical protein N7482_000097 [Penicillium canariense]
MQREGLRSEPPFATWVFFSFNHPSECHSDCTTRIKITPDTQNFNHNPEFVRQLDLMIKDVQARQSLLQKIATLREQFSRVQIEKIQIRTYLNSRIPLWKGTRSSTPKISPIPRSTTGTSGQS